MKLRNKKNGWIVDFSKGNFISSKDYGLVVYIDDHRGIRYNSLAEFNEEWEDYEEPKQGYWFIDVGTYEVDWCEENEDTKADKEIGNYFGTKEEAEKAVKKLKAWKRLKDKGFGFESWFGGSKVISFRINEWIDGDIAKDLDLLFGGGE